MTVFPVIEGYRRELRAMSFPRLGGAERAELDRCYASMHHSNAIEGVHPTSELKALFQMFVDEAVPPAVSDAFLDHYIRESIIGTPPFVKGFDHAS